MINSDNNIEALEELLEKNKDAHKGYKQAAKLVQDDSASLNSYFQHQATQRERFSTELETCIRSCGREPNESGSMAASAHRAWMSLKDTFSANDAQSILAECERGDEAAVNEYEEKIRENSFDPSIETKLRSQVNDIRSALSQVKQLQTNQ